MPTFTLVADIEFEADDLDHAVELLRGHFDSLVHCDDDAESPLEFTGEMTVEAK